MGKVGEVSGFQNHTTVELKRASRIHECVVNVGAEGGHGLCGRVEDDDESAFGNANVTV